MTELFCVSSSCVVSYSDYWCTDYRFSLKNLGRFCTHSSHTTFTTPALPRPARIVGLTPLRHGGESVHLTRGAPGGAGGAYTPPAAVSADLTSTPSTVPSQLESSVSETCAYLVQGGFPLKAQTA
jgi:hypothetical protein